MRYLLTNIIIAIFVCAPTFAQNRNSTKTNDEVNLTVSGTGSTKDEAIKSALRSGIEQTFGTFVSSNTEILNDDLIKDEIVSVNSGTIKNYKELNSCQLPSGLFSVTLKATISIGELVKFSESKGSHAELSGSTFAYNIKMRELNTISEKKAIENLTRQIIILGNSIYDKELILKEPKLANTGYEIPMTINFHGNINLNNTIAMIFSTLSSLSLSESEVSMYKANNMTFYECVIGIEDIRNINSLNYDKDFFCIVYDTKGRENGNFKNLKYGNVVNKSMQIWRFPTHSSYFTCKKVIRCAFRNDPGNWFATLSQAFSNCLNRVTLHDNLGHTEVVNSKNYHTDSYRGDREFLVRFSPVKFNYYIPKDDISKYSDFVVE